MDACSQVMGSSKADALEQKVLEHVNDRYFACATLPLPDSVSSTHPIPPFQCAVAKQNGFAGLLFGKLF